MHTAYNQTNKQTMVKRTLRRKFGRSRRRKTHALRRKTLTRRSQRGGTIHQVFDEVIAELIEACETPEDLHTPTDKQIIKYIENKFSNCENFQHALQLREDYSNSNGVSLKDIVCTSEYKNDIPFSFKYTSRSSTSSTLDKLCIQHWETFIQNLKLAVKFRFDNDVNFMTLVGSSDLDDLKSVEMLNRRIDSITGTDELTKNGLHKALERILKRRRTESKLPTAVKATTGKATTGKATTGKATTGTATTGRATTGKAPTTSGISGISTAAKDTRPFAPDGWTLKGNVWINANGEFVSEDFYKPNPNAMTDLEARLAATLDED